MFLCERSIQIILNYGTSLQLMQLLLIIQTHGQMMPLALPLGNGSLGAMVFGDVNKERIQLNEETMWSGSPQESDNPRAAVHLDKIKELLFAGKYKEATELTNRIQVCTGLGSGGGIG